MSIHDEVDKAILMFFLSRRRALVERYHQIC